MNIRAKTGSLLVTMIFVILLAGVVLGIIGLALQSKRLALYNEFRAKAQLVAESELEQMYYQFRDTVASKGKQAVDVPASLASLGVADNAKTPATVRDAYLTKHSGWKVRRSIHVAQSAFSGVEPSTGDVATITYLDARVEVLAPEGTLWKGQTVRVGRQFSSSSATVFQNCIFYQGDLEFAPGGDTTIDGTIVANGSIYMGASNASKLTINGAVKYMHGYGFNTDPGADEDFGTADDVSDIYRKPGTPGGSTLTPPFFTYGIDQQVKESTIPLNLVGGADPESIQAARPDLFPTVNDVYRSVIAPPPSAGNTNEYASPGTLTDDAAIASARLYNRADLIVTVETDGSFTIKDRDGTDKTVAYSSAIKAPKNVYDQREGRNVRMTEIDVATLGTLLKDDASFKGVLYVNLKSGTSANPAAVRLVDAETIPLGVGNKDYGFSVATNGGLYVQGNYNTTPLADGSYAKAMLLGDAVTALSAGWSDANAALDIADRVASADIRINAGLLVGNTPASATDFSGGAQNLVRYLENWEGRSVTFHGSFGRLFDAKMFTRPFQQPGSIYLIPDLRTFSYDKNLTANSGPPGSPQNAITARGRFYFW